MSRHALLLLVGALGCSTLTTASLETNPALRGATSNGGERRQPVAQVDDSRPAAWRMGETPATRGASRAQPARARVPATHPRPQKVAKAKPRPQKVAKAKPRPQKVAKAKPRPQKVRRASRKVPSSRRVAAAKANTKNKKNRVAMHRPSRTSRSVSDGAELDAVPSKPVRYDGRGQALDDEVPDVFR